MEISALLERSSNYYSLEFFFNRRTDYGEHPRWNIMNATKSMGESIANQSSAVVGNLTQSVVTSTASAASNEIESIVNQTASTAVNMKQDLSTNSTT